MNATSSPAIGLPNKAVDPTVRAVSLRSATRPAAHRCYRALFMSRLPPFSLTLVEGSLPAPA